MYGLTSRELEGMDRYSLFLHKITHNTECITIRHEDDTVWVITSHRRERMMMLLSWDIAKNGKKGKRVRNMLGGEIHNWLDHVLFSSYKGRSPIVSIVVQRCFETLDHTDEYNLLYSEFLNWSEE